MLVTALISFIAILAGRYGFLWLTGIASLGIMVFTLFNFVATVNKMKSDMQTDLADTHFVVSQNSQHSQCSFNGVGHSSF